ncbi:MAG: ATP-binding protein [Bacteroidales bacterium]|nr:ATP-binding protein [Bacteroidales bacterium]
MIFEKIKLQIKKFILSTIQLRIDWKIKIYVLTTIVGAIVGLLILFPLNQGVLFYEYVQHEIDAPTLIQFIQNQFNKLYFGESTGKLIFYSTTGALLGLLTARIHVALNSKLRYIEQLSGELTKDVKKLISHGESSAIEFKSSFRWDIKQSKVNKDLVFVILKAIAGFMNNDGGTLLIGIADDGKIVGLEKDYQNLKKPDRDGFEQSIFTAISTNLGTDLSNYVHVIFHTMDSNDICRLIIMPAPRPVFIKQEGNPKLYIRAGVSTRELNIEEATKFINNRWQK